VASKWSPLSVGSSKSYLFYKIISQFLTKCITTDFFVEIKAKICGFLDVIPQVLWIEKKSVIFLRFEFEILATIPKSMSTKSYYVFFSINMKDNLMDLDNVIHNLLLFSDLTRKFGD